MKIKSSKIYPILIVANIAVVFAAAILLILIMSKNASSMVLEKQLREQEIKLADLQMLKVLVENTKEQQSYISGLLVDKEKIINFLSLVESLSGTSGAKINVVSVNEEKPDASSGIIKIRLNISGSWEQVFKTVSMIDHLPAAISVKEVQIGKEISTENSGGKSVPARTFWSANVGAEVIKF